MDTTKPDDVFAEGIERYKAGEPVEDLIPVFKGICDRVPKNSASWTCLSWLYLLAGKGKLALDAAKKAVKFNGDDPQARVNLAIAMLETQQKGVREHIEVAQQLIMLSAELRDDVKTSLEDGLTRKPDWKALLKVQQWLFES